MDVATNPDNGLNVSGFLIFVKVIENEVPPRIVLGILTILKVLPLYPQATLVVVPE